MTNEELSKWLAMNVMKWHSGATKTKEYGAYYEDNYYGIIFKYWKKDWSPPTNIIQAMMCLKKIKENGYSYQIEAVPSISSVLNGGVRVILVKSVYPPSGLDLHNADIPYWIYIAETPELAICRAIYEIKR